MPALHKGFRVNSSATAEWIERIVTSAWFSYVTILLLQLKTAWRLWEFRDLTSGDTSSYFLNALEWHRIGTTQLAWSPLYTSFYGSLLHFSNDAFVVTTAHRVVIIIALAILVLAVMRRLLPYGLAWLAAAWWVVLPINFDALYEVHQFALIPALLAVLVVSSKPTPLARGISGAILAATTLLMRNELAVATALWLLVCLAYEWRRQSERGIAASLQTLRKVAFAYGVPMILTGMLVLWCADRASDLPMLDQALQRKHTLNICQTYAFGYQQRHTDFPKSPWIECQQLMQRVYGQPEPSLTQALSRNPGAMAEHFLWNVRLLPYGLQMLFFNAAPTAVTPDYVLVPRGGSWLWIATLLVCALTAAGVVRLWVHRVHWWEYWLHDRIWGFILLGFFGVVALIVAITQRPRPSYLFAAGIGLKATVLLLLYVLTAKYWKPRATAILFAFTAAAVLLWTRPYYPAEYAGRPRPLLQTYNRLRFFQPLIERPQTALTGFGLSGEVCNYLAKGVGCLPLAHRSYGGDVDPGKELEKVSSVAGANLVYLEESVLNPPEGAKVVAGFQAGGWDLIAMRDALGDRWALLSKRTQP